MQLNEEVFLSLVEETHSLAFVDIEATGLRGDYNSVLVVSIKPYGQKPYSFHIKQAGNDQKVVKDAKAEMEKYQCWCTYYGKGFDIPMLNTRLLKWGSPPIDKRPHIDMYFSLKSNLLTARKSQGHLLSFLETPEEKMSVTPNAWSEIVGDPSGPHMKTMIKRCESDVEGLEALYNKTKHIIREIKR
jgi:uncharacterized protein YprB with RNaseH-like and TPR domain